MILKTVPWCWGYCSQDFDNWKLAVFCKLLHSQWRYFTAVGKIKIDIGLTLLISAKYKKHVHWLPCWVSISGSGETALVFLLFFLFCLLPLCYGIIQNTHWVCTDYTVSYGVYLLWNLLYFIMLAVWTCIYRKERSFCTFTTFNFVKRLIWGHEQDDDDMNMMR